MFGWEMITQNIEDGYSEACVRALSKSFLREEHYQSLVSCNSLEEFKLVLDETDYGKYIIMNDGGKLDSIWLKQRLYLKLRDEIEYLMG
jgi:V-type H+-transporting ATPase subunit d